MYLFSLLDVISCLFIIIVDGINRKYITPSPFALSLCQMKAAPLLWLVLFRLCMCSMASANLRACSVSSRRKKACVCHWDDCLYFSDLLAEHDPDWSGFTRVKKSQTSLISAIDFHLKPSWGSVANKSEIKVAHHHWYRQLVVDNLQLPGADPLVGKGYTGRRVFSSSLTRDEAKKYHERMVDGANSVIRCLEHAGEEITDDLKKKHRGLFVQAPLVTRQELLDYVKPWKKETGQARAERAEERRSSLELPSVTPSVRKVLRTEDVSPSRIDSLLEASRRIDSSQAFQSPERTIKTGQPPSASSTGSSPGLIPHVNVCHAYIRER
jgi:hypothetical protein